MISEISNGNVEGLIATSYGSAMSKTQQIDFGLLSSENVDGKFINEKSLTVNTGCFVDT
jgi:hypothetical protein